EIESHVTSVGASTYRPSESARGSMTLNLVPRDQRERSSAQIANALRPLLDGIPGTEVRSRAGRGLRILNLISNEDDNVQVEVRGFDFEILNALAQEVEAEMALIEGVTDARTSREAGQPQELVRIDR